jgi:peptidoglycan/LPS O-acetylase OafA/YrhL
MLKITSSDSLPSQLLRHRKEIDGLRSIAVLPVILFHAGFEFASGGFVGVDVFFVISGYLITNQIVSEKVAGTFSLADFYERRARRILPALFVVVACCIPFAWLWMTPLQLKEFAKSLVAVCLFSSNIEFWKETGYFAPAVGEKPLLHTWSLAVEEQYYLLFPLFIIVGWRYGQRSIVVLVIILGLISLALAEYSSRHYAGANFYLLPTRAWELLIGATVAMFLLKRTVTSCLTNNVLSSVGLILILFSVFGFGKTTPFPGFYALVPTLGTALIILWGVRGTLVHSLLSQRPLVGLGLISYSLYLWHQPLLAFGRLHSLYPIPEAVFIFLALMSLPLAWFTWRFVEVPARKRSCFEQRALITVMPTAATIICAVGIIFYFHIGFSTRNDLLSTFENRIAHNYGLSAECDRSDDGFQVRPACESGPHPTIAVWGDSFAMHLVDGVIAANPKRSIVQVTRSVCGPIVGLGPTNSEYPLDWAKSCLSFNYSVFAYLKDRPDIVDVVLSSLFEQYVSGDFDFLTDQGLRKTDTEFARIAFLRTIRSLNALGKKVTIVSPPARNGNNIGRCLFRAMSEGRSLTACDFSVELYRTFALRTTDFLKSIERSGEARIIWLPKYTCAELNCPASVNGVLLYQDNAHLSREGSAWIGSNTPALRLSQ